MYIDWFKLKKLPFRLRPDPEFLYLEGAMGAAYAALRNALTGTEKLVCILGEPGVGKTTLLQALARDCGASARVVRIQQPNLTSMELSAALSEQLGLPLPDDATHEPLAHVQSFIAAEIAQGHAVVILVDQAHCWPNPMLRELLLLVTLPRPPLVVLAGEDDLAKSIATIESSGVKLPTISTLQLTRFAQSQVPGYLAHRLSIAGSEGRELFERDTIHEIFRYSGGTPKLINTLCDSALMFAESHSMARVGIIEIRDAARELNWIEFSARGAPTAIPADTVNSGHSESLPHATTLTLEVRRNGEFVSQVALVPGRLVVGRGSEAGLRLESPFISRRHCQFITTAEQTLVEDLGSANGIHINGQRYHVYRLAAGDQVTLSDYTLDCIGTGATPAS